MQAGQHTLSDHCSFKFGERAKHLKHSAAGWCGRIQSLLVKADAFRVQFGKERHCQRCRCARSASSFLVVTLGLDGLEPTGPRPRAREIIEEFTS
jgi:hypothetical protein